MPSNCCHSNRATIARTFIQPVTRARQATRSPPLEVVRAPSKRVSRSSSPSPSTSPFHCPFPIPWPFHSVPMAITWDAIGRPHPPSGPTRPKTQDPRLNHPNQVQAQSAQSQSFGSVGCQSIGNLQKFPKSNRYLMISHGANHWLCEIFGPSDGVCWID